MILHKILGVLLTNILIFGLAAVVRADGPLSNQKDFVPLPVQAGQIVVDPSSGAVIQAQLTENGKPSVATVPAIKQALPSVAAPQSVTSSGQSRTLISDETVTVHEPLPVNPAQRSVANPTIGPAASTLITFENFESGFPTAGWTRSGTHQWDDVNCFPASGARSAWPAANAIDPCSGGNYPNNMDALLRFGPFNLADAQSASLDFYFRLNSQSDGVCNPITNCDFLFWGASIDGTQFFGDFAAGSYNGIFVNGYNFASLDLSSFAGEPQVWVGFAFVSDGSGVGQGPFIDYVTLRKNTGPRLHLTDENFDVLNFPNQLWENLDNDGITNGDFRWDDEPCFSRSGLWAMWPAGDGADALDPCTGNLYPNNARSWLIHGPFSLAGASEAWVDFYFRNQSELDFDFLYWAASINGSQFYGPPGISGSQISGPYGNGYNLMRFDLSNVFTLGDLRGQPQVWLAFIFESDFSFTFQGPFIDDVRVVIEGQPSQPGITQLFLPITIKNEVSTKTNLFVNNQTGGNLTFFRVQGTLQGTIQCDNIPNGVTAPCGIPFESGSYSTTASPTQCSQTTKTKFYPAGNFTVTVTCTSN